MDEIFICEYSYPYDGSVIIGVFTTLERAMDFMGHEGYTSSGFDDGIWRYNFNNAVYGQKNGCIWRADLNKKLND